MKNFHGMTVYVTALAGVISISGLASLIMVNIEKQQFGSRAYCVERSLADMWGVNIFRSPLESDYWCEIPASIQLNELISQIILLFGFVILMVGIFLLRSQKGSNREGGKLGQTPTSDFAAQLRDLESLRKEGVLSDSEFAAQKKRLLSNN
jgi:hypothetical protein